ncbi:MAG: hypothetical protein WCE61_11530 [Candidatus Acidiferrum sp.]
MSKAFRNEGREVFQQDGLSTKNDNRDLSLLQILLVFKSTINGQDNVKSRSLGCGQKLTVLKSSKSSVSGRLAIVTGTVVAQSFAHALIEKNLHSCLSGKKLLSLLERSDSHLSRNGWVTFKELFERVASFQGVEEQLNWHSSPAKHRRTTQNLRILDDDAIR